MFTKNGGNSFMRSTKRYWNVYTRLLLIIFLALLAAVGTTYLNKNYIDSKVEMIKVVVPSEHIKPYTELTKGLLTYRDVIKSEIPGDAIYDKEEFLKEGSKFTGEIGLVKGYPVKESLTVNSFDSVFGAAIALKDGKSYLGIATDQVRSQLVKPGTLVDLYCFIEGDTQTGESVVISKIEEPLFASLYVHSLKGKNNEELKGAEGESSPAVVVVETVSPEQTSKIIRYQMSGKMYLVPVGADSKKHMAELTEKV